uniref:Uncharacterized protein n=1 Tax=Arundo donax TaxID=35708 RepID=A0A0A9FTH8_ARUDO
MSVLSPLDPYLSSDLLTYVQFFRLSRNLVFLLGVGCQHHRYSN